MIISLYKHTLNTLIQEIFEKDIEIIKRIKTFDRNHAMSMTNIVVIGVETLMIY